MIKIVNPTRGTLRFDDISVKEKSEIVVTEGQYNKNRKQIDYAAMKGWCTITEINHEKKVSKIKKEESKSVAKEEVKDKKK